MPPVTKPAGTFPEADQRNLGTTLADNGRPHRQAEKPISLKGSKQKHRARENKEHAIHPRVFHACHVLRSSLYFFSHRSCKFDSSLPSSHSWSRSRMIRSYSDRGSRPPRRGSSRSPSINLRNSSPSGSANRVVLILMASGDRVLRPTYPVRSGRCATPSSATASPSS